MKWPTAVADESEMHPKIGSIGLTHLAAAEVFAQSETEHCEVGNSSGR